MQSKLRPELHLLCRRLQLLRHIPKEKERPWHRDGEQAFHGYAASIDGPFRGLGCLMCNTAVERAALDPGSGRYVAAYLERLNLAFGKALNHARREEQISPTVDIDEMAGFLTTALIGIAASVRAEAPPAQVWAAYNVVVGMLNNLSAENPR